MLKNYSFTLFVVALLMAISAACTSPSPPRYYLLSENPPRIIELDPAAPADRRETRRFDLTFPPLGDEGPEGIAFVPNSDVQRYGLFGLERSANGGYFLLAVQANAMLYVFDIPLPGDDDAQITPIWRVSIPNLTRDASALFYAQGEIWVIGASDKMLYRLKTKEKAGQAIVRDVYRLDSLPFSAEDVEGLGFLDSGDAILADDGAETVTRYNDFPACLLRQDCEAIWVNDVSPREASGAAWDAYNQRLLIVSDEGELFSLSPDGDYLETIFFGDFDLEGVTVRGG
ncbi:MAG TPA: hypothetical protein G4N96_07880 [Chloroflexi bacterium]|nr:hypothetical protein [Chloroflexota bacterium]